jgi:hypothetical protein
MFVLLSLSAFAGPAPSPVVVKSPHYTVTSWAGTEAAQTADDVMEALLTRYNSLFLFDLSRVQEPWNVVLYATKDDFDAALAGLVPSPPKDYVYLQFADSARSRLYAWIPAEGSPVDQVRSLAFQGFFQFLWTFVPHPPAWIETGLATVFWNSRWDGKTLTPNPDQPFLEILQQKWKDKAPDLKALLTAPEGSLDAVSGQDLEAWGLAAFLLESPEPTYSRLLGSVLADLSPTATEEVNSNAVLQRFQTSKDLDAAAKDVQAYWKNKIGFRTRIDQGNAQLKEKNFRGASASFQAALALRPDDDGALYYAGLAAYEAKDYSGAEGFFSKVVSQSLPPGLLAYARGLNAFALKKNDQAKVLLNQAKTEDAAAWGKLTAPVLELIR